ncbi:SLC13 family permease [Desulfovibrio aminophilus]|nr:SLC13 family permease [Desulfovibrio aminophilus]
MTPLTDVLAYVWERLPLMLLFADGYLAYRLLAVTGLTDWAVRQAVLRSRGRPSRVILYVLAASAGLSAFIPNAVAVLAVLPVITALDREHGLHRPDAPMSTALALAAMYGANIGGMASLIGSPANLVLLGVLDLYAVPGREQISFFNWFLWGLPLAAILGAIGWGLITFLALPRGAGSGLPPTVRPPVFGPRQRVGARLYALFLAFWITEALLKEFLSGFAAWEAPVALAFSAWFCLECFRPRRLDGPAGPLLPPRSLPAGIPARGLLWLGALVLAMILGNALGLDRDMAGFFQRAAAAAGSQFLLTLTFALAAIFLTEVLSNTVVAVAFFPVAFFTAQSLGLDPLPLMITISVAATCAFMTPVATIPNALAYGALPGTSLRRMLGVGLVMNTLCALAMTAWLCLVIPALYE